MSKNLRRLIVLTNWGTEKVFWPYYDTLIRHLPAVMTEHDTLLLEGGADISPSIYGQPVGRNTYPSALHRDKYEIEAFRRAQSAGASVIGICRGAQLATAMLGAPLIQHVEGHEGAGHFLQLYKQDGALWANSVHHQMMYPFALAPEEYQLIGWTAKPCSTKYLDGKNQDISKSLPDNFVEPEIVWYPTIRTLAIQGHPEYQESGEDFRAYCENLAKELILNA